MIVSYTARFICEPNEPPNQEMRCPYCISVKSITVPEEREGVITCSTCGNSFSYSRELKMPDYIIRDGKYYVLGDDYERTAYVFSPERDLVRTTEYYYPRKDDIYQVITEREYNLACINELEEFLSSQVLSMRDRKLIEGEINYLRRLVGRE